MTVGELKELLDDYGDHLPVELYDDDRGEVLAIDEVTGQNTDDGVVIMISFSTN